MYRIYCGDRLIYDSTQADVNPILSGNASLEDNRSATLKFTLLKDHPDLSYMTRMAATIRLYGEETEPIFVGRIVNDVTDFNGNREFTCEGELSFFMDSIQRPFDFGDSPENYFKYFINQHNLQVESDRQFTAGTVTVTDPNNYISRSNSFYETTWENMQSRLLSPLGGHLVAVHTASGTTLNWLEEYPDRNTQEIRFGENLLGVQKKLDSAQIATAIIPLGASYTDSNDQEHRLTIEEVNDGEDYIYNAEAVAQYGWIFKVVTWDDVTIAANLLTKAQAYLEDAVKSIASIELTAADLSALDHDIKEFRLGDMVHIVSEPHGIDDEYLLTKQSIDLLHPEANTITLGHTYRTFTGNAANIGKTAAAARGIALAQSARVDAVHERAVDAQEVAAQALPKFGECRSTAGTQNKVNYQIISGFVLEPGATVTLLMKYKNSINYPTLNINGTGAKPIVIADGTALTEDNSAVIGWDDESLVQFVYDGTNWRIDDCAALTRIQHILTEDIVGDHGWINLKDGFFNFDNKLIWDIVSGTTPTLTVEGTINATSGTIGGFTANGTTLYKDTTINSKTHRAYIQAPTTPDADSWAFGVRNVTDSDNIFLVRYDGKLFAKDAEISGTISGSTITGSTLNGANIVGQDFDVNIRADITGPGASDTYNKKYIGITTPNTYYDSGWRIFYPVLQEQVEIRNSSDQTQIGFRMMIDPFNAIRFQAKGSSDSDYYTAVTIRGSSMTVNGTISASGSISSDGSICSGGKASVWDSNAGGIMSAGGVLSLRANSSVTPGLYVTAYGSTTTTYDAGLYYNSTADRWQSNKQIYAPSFYATGTITVEKSDTTAVAQRVSNSVGNIALYVTSAGNRGIYDNTDNEWLFYKNASTGQRGPYATTSKSGFMSPADKTKLDGVATGAGRLRRVSVTSSSFTAAASGAGNVTLTPTIPSGYSLVGVVLATTNNTNVGIVRTNSASSNTAVEVRYKNFATSQQTGVTITVSCLLSNGIDIV